MALNGTIESFGISEIFQLVSHQQKTGTLEINTNGGVAKLRFLNGNLLEAWPDKRSPAELIGALLVRTGRVTPTQLNNALETQRESLRRIGDVLIRMGAIRISEFQEILALQHRETVYKLLRLKRGRFRFVPEPVEIEPGVSVPMDIGALLMEGFRQIDEWPNLIEKIPSERKVYGRVNDAPPPADLSPAETTMLMLVDGVSTVRSIVDRSRLGEFGAWEALASLFDRRLIRPVGAARIPRIDPKRLGLNRLADGVAALLLLGLTAAFLTFLADYGGNRVGNLLTAVEGLRAEARQVEQRVGRWATRQPLAWAEHRRRR